MRRSVRQGGQGVAPRAATSMQPQTHTRPRSLVALTLLLVGCALLLATPSSAQAGTEQVSVMMDDDLLLYGSDFERDRTLDIMRRLGVDVVRVSVLWRVVAPSRVNHRFDGRNPRHYRQGILRRYDLLVQGARARGMHAYLNVTPPGPSWAHRRSRSRRLNRLGTHMPNRPQFARFVEMIGNRYDGSQRDHFGRPIPRVNVWSIGNEPNQGGWLTPQRRPVGRYWIAASPHIYRELYISARAALRRSGHENDVIFMGELAPLGTRRRSSTAPLRPIEFLREMFCLSRTYRPYRGRSARLRGCNLRRMREIRTSALAYHPYARERSPDFVPRHRDESTISNLSRVTRALDRIAVRTRKVSRSLPLMLSEFGYETNPPDPFFGVPIQDHAPWINEADFIAYKNPRVIGTTQFLIRDAPSRDQHSVRSRAHWLNYQTGLFFRDGLPKPAAAAYALPVFFRRDEGVVRIWGQLRFLRSFPPFRAEVQARAVGSEEWRTVAEVTFDNPRRFFETFVRTPFRGEWRAVWRNGSGQISGASREVEVPGA